MTWRRTSALVLATGLLLAACTTERSVRAARSDAIVESSTVASIPVGTDPPPSSAPSPTVPPSTRPAPSGTPSASTPPAAPSGSSSDTSPPATSVPQPDTGDGVGDELFPDLGNPGIDVTNYTVRLSYDPDADTIEGSVSLDVNLSIDLDTFTLDAVDLDISRVAVDGADAEFEVDDPELRITPSAPLKAGDQVDVTVDYSGTPAPSTSPSGIPNGWFHTGSGSYVLNEPDGARSWLPSNDHPSDKATWQFEITVPEGMTVVANGLLEEHEVAAGEETWIWRESQPMATYLVLLLTGAYDLVEGTAPNGVPLVSAVLRDDRHLMQPYTDSIDEQMVFFEPFFGPYPLDAYGIAITDSFGGLAMETQSRSMFSRDDFASGDRGYVQELLLSHELAHMWFGDAVTLGVWKDIWLNEGFATYAQWMWLDHVGHDDLDALADEALSQKQHADESSADPDIEGLFSGNSYEGAAVVLHALRQVVGDDVFFELLRAWVAAYSGESAVTADFVELAGDVAGCDLTAFFDEWLLADDAPDRYPGDGAGYCGA